MFCAAIIVAMIAFIPPIEGSSSGIHSQASQGCGCHSSSSTPTLNHNFPTTYTGGQVYSIQISVTGGVSGSNGGFNVEVDKGTMSTGMGIMAVKVNTAGTSATHTTNSYRSWSFDWTAPSAGSGDVTVDIAVMTANGANGNSGDAWTNTQLTVPEPGSTNTAPVASNVYISDGPAGANGGPITARFYDEDMHALYDYSDAENDPDSGTQIRWIKDGTIVSQENNNPILPSSATTIGEIWTMRVTPSDGTDFGTPVTSSNSVEIIDYDADNDGYGDQSDAFPNDPNEHADSDSDGVGDNADAFPNDPTETLDSDSDGVGDNADAFPNDPTETLDSDDDGTGDNADIFPDDATEQADNDSDGIGNNADVFPDDATEQADNDSDGVGNNADVFPDDATETLDSDSDGVGDNADAFPNNASETLDSDGDGVGDNADAFPTDATETVDTDDDGYGDNGDAFPSDVFEWMDSDNDSVGDNSDAFPNDANETLDSDNDGMGDNEQAVLEAKIAQEEEDAAAQQQTLIQGGIGLLIVVGVAVAIIRRRGGSDVAESKDFASLAIQMEPTPMATSPEVSAEPVQAVPPAAPMQAVELTVENQWTDESGHTWRLMSDGSNLWWNGSDWQKV